MATLKITGNAELIHSFSELASMPSSVVIEMASAMGKKITDAERNYARSNLNIKGMSKGGVAGGVNMKTPMKTSSGASVTINFVGTQHGNRIGEIAFINEYGKKSMPARTWIKNANDTVEDAAVQAAEDVLDKFLASKGF